MPKAYTKVFTLPGPTTGKPFKITSVVLDLDEYHTLCEDLGNSQNLSKEEVQFHKDKKTIPFVQKAENTKFMFERYEITTTIAAFIVRGMGREIAKQLLSE